MNAERNIPTVEFPFHDSSSLHAETEDQSGTSSMATFSAVQGSDTKSRDEPPLAGSVKLFIDPDKPVALEDWNMLKE